MKYEEIHFQKISSTQEYAKKHSLEFARDAITCILADEQTQGRGQHQKKWLSPPGVNLYATFAFRLKAPAPGLENLTKLLANSLIAIFSSYQLKATLKWPNDIFLNQKKLAGVLCEIASNPLEHEIALGIGINVNTAPDVLAQIDQPATSLFAETGRFWDRSQLWKQLQQQFRNELKKKYFL